MSQSFSFVSTPPSNPGKPGNFHPVPNEQPHASSLLAATKGGSEILVKANAKDTSLPVPETPKTKVIVVGAGISGLRAASVLQRHGLEVVVLEGRDRIGGRICTTRPKGKPARDIGMFQGF